MSSTKLMLSILITFITTWLVLGVIVWLLSDVVAYKEVIRHPGMIVFMFIFGWLPCIPVYTDLEERL